MIAKIADFLFKNSPAIESFLIAGLLVFQYFPQKLCRALPILAKRNITFLKVLKIALVFLVGLVLARSFLLTLGQYLVWRAGSPGIYFLPPYKPLSYFWNYTWQRFGKEAVVTLILAGLFLVIFKIANFFTQDRLFYDEEPYLAGVAILASGWPNSLLVIGGSLLGAALSQIFLLFWRLAKKKPAGRFPLIYFWLPLALLSVIFGDIIGQGIGFAQFKI